MRILRENLPIYEKAITKSFLGAVLNMVFATDILSGVVPGREELICGPIQTVIQPPHQISSWNVDTRCGRACEVVETTGCRCISRFCVQGLY